MADPRTVAHVRFLDVRALFQTAQLEHHPVSNVAVVFRLAGLEGLHQSEFNHLLVQHKVQGHQIRTAFLQGGAVLFDGLLGLAHSVFQFSRSVTDNFVHSRVQLSGQCAMAFSTSDLDVVVCKLR